ncbi:MAG: DUF502 domain-containing protein [Simkaniaceae bacterium]
MGKIFMRGLIAIAPIAITIAIFIWLFTLLENVFGSLIKDVIGPSYYFPGLGILITLVLIFCVGLIINTFVIQKFYNFGEKLLQKIPLVKTLYGSITDLMSFFHTKNPTQKERVVSIFFSGTKLIGLVTRESFEGLVEGIGGEDEIAVFLPMSYQIGGYTVIVPRSSVKPIQMSIEEAMRFVVTAGAPGKKK